MGAGDSKSRFLEASAFLSESTLGPRRIGVLVDVIVPLLALLLLT
jgi:hypothetical protein